MNKSSFSTDFTISHDLDLLFVTETWVLNNDPDATLNLTVYHQPITVSFTSRARRLLDEAGEEESASFTEARWLSNVILCIKMSAADGLKDCWLQPRLDIRVVETMTWSSRLSTDRRILESRFWTVSSMTLLICWPQQVTKSTQID